MIEKDILIGAVIAVLAWLGIIASSSDRKRISRDNRQPKSNRSDIDAERANNNELRKLDITTRENQRKHTGKLRKNNTTSRESNSRIREILESAKKRKPNG